MFKFSVTSVEIEKSLLKTKHQASQNSDQQLFQVCFQLPISANAGKRLNARGNRREATIVGGSSLTHRLHIPLLLLYVVIDVSTAK